MEVTVKAKIARSSQIQVESAEGKFETVFSLISFSKSGREIEMSEKDLKYCQDAFKRFMKAQNMMKIKFEE